MKILVTGNQGYIGSVLVPILIAQGHEVTGYDTGYYGADCLLYKTQPLDFKQIKKDIRDASAADLKGIEAVVHLAALSNDPLGELAEELTQQINFEATVKLAQLAKAAGVKRFVYSSSQSMYGIAQTEAELAEDAPKAPLTAYARTKWEAEVAIKKLAGKDFGVVCFRPSTVFGASSKLRCDIVFNNLVACAYTTGKIEIKSDGTPHRPVVHILDVCQAYLAGLTAPLKLVSGQSYNVGIENGNYTVRQLAEAAQKVVSGSNLTFTGEHGRDSRTYRISFDKILSELKDYFKPEWDLLSGGRQLVELFGRVNFNEAQFRGRMCNRLKQIKYLLEHNKLDKDLRWKA